jgi:hypothetical protein
MRRFLAPGAILAAAIASLVFLSTAVADSPKGRFHSAHTTDSKETRAERTVFAPDSPKVYVDYTLADVNAGQKVKIVWTAEKAEGVQENSKMNEAETIASSMVSGLFSYSKPTKGWPAGTYRVDLFIDGRLDKTIRFKVAK